MVITGSVKGVGMLYAVGDSNSVYTFDSLHEIHRVMSDLRRLSFPPILQIPPIPPIPPPFVKSDMCEVGWTTDEVLGKVLEKVKKKKEMPRATGFFVFMGLNDQHTGQHTADNIVKVVNKLYELRAVPIIVAVPFCVKNAVTKATDLKMCKHRQTAATDVKERLKGDKRVTIITVHVTDAMYVREEFETLKKDSLDKDPLHLNTKGYEKVAEAVQNAWFQSLLRAATRSYTKQKK